MWTNHPKLSSLASALLSDSPHVDAEKFVALLHARAMCFWLRPEAFPCFGEECGAFYGDRRHVGLLVTKALFLVDDVLRDLD